MSATSIISLKGLLEAPPRDPATLLADVRRSYPHSASEEIGRLIASARAAGCEEPSYDGAVPGAESANRINDLRAMLREAQVRLEEDQFALARVTRPSAASEPLTTGAASGDARSAAAQRRPRMCDVPPQPSTAFSWTTAALVAFLGGPLLLLPAEDGALTGSRHSVSAGVVVFLGALAPCWLWGFISGRFLGTGGRVSLRSHLPGLVAPLVLGVGVLGQMSDPYLWRFVCNATWRAVHLPVVGTILALASFPVLAALMYYFAVDAARPEFRRGRPSAHAYRAAILGLLAVTLSAFPLVVSYVADEERHSKPAPSPQVIYARGRLSETTARLTAQERALRPRESAAPNLAAELAEAGPQVLAGLATGRYR